MAMSTSPEQQAAQREELSALMDGELDGGRVAGACDQWRRAGDARAAWHAYHLIGDALRSDDLATEPTHDTAFLAALRLRLAAEPVVMAPRPLESVSPAAQRQVAGLQDGGARRRTWLAPAAIAAGFVSVAAVVMLTTAPMPADVPVAAVGAPLVAAVAGRSVATPAVAAASASVMAAAPAPEAGVNEQPQTVVANPQLIRSARLDRYLSAHQQFAGSSALGVASGYMRHATADAGAR